MSQPAENKLKRQRKRKNKNSISVPSTPTPTEESALVKNSESESENLESSEQRPSKKQRVGEKLEKKAKLILAKSEETSGTEASESLGQRRKKGTPGTTQLTKTGSEASTENKNKKDKSELYESDLSQSSGDKRTKNKKRMLSSASELSTSHTKSINKTQSKNENLAGKIEKKSKVEESIEGDNAGESDDEDAQMENAAEEAESINHVTHLEAPPLEDLPTHSSVDDSFNSLQIHEHTKKALAEMGLTKMMPVQQACIPEALNGRDILASAKTGSGKTLAFLIPALELLVKAQFKPRNGTGVLVVAPTRELAMQIYGVCSELMKFHVQKTFALVTGGTPKGPEDEKLKRGANILIGTPGRILDHLLHTEGFNIKNLKCLIIDEADRLLQEGFEEEIRSIVKSLPEERQTMLFSATQTRNVKDLAKLSLKSKPHEVHVDIHKTIATAEGLEQGYVICDSDLRFLLLFTFLKKNIDKKIIVFFSSCASVSYHADLLNYIDVNVLSLHGNKKQKQRAKTFFEFKNAKTGILLSTDVAARGLDIPAVDWIVQFDPPDDPKEYIHRVGRTARGLNGKGKALLFLLPSEVQFLKYLRSFKVPLEEYEFPKNKIANIQAQLEKLVETIYYLNQSAREAYKGYLRSYNSHSLKDTFDVNQLDLRKVAISFGLTVPPLVTLNASTKSNNNTSTQRYTGPVEEHFPGWKKGSKRNFNGRFSAENPYGKRSSEDKRQFQH